MSHLSLFLLQVAIKVKGQLLFMEFLQHSGNFLVIWLVNQIAHEILAIIRPLFVKNMALSKPVPNAGDEIDLKIHYLYYNENASRPFL